MQIISVVNFIIFLLKVFLRIKLANLTYSDWQSENSRGSSFAPLHGKARYINISVQRGGTSVWRRDRSEHRSLQVCSVMEITLLLTLSLLVSSVVLSGLAGRMALHRSPRCVALGLCGAAGGWHRVCSSAESCSYTSGGLGESGRSKSIFPW